MEWRRHYSLTRGSSSFHADTQFTVKLLHACPGAGTTELQDIHAHFLYVLREDHRFVGRDARFYCMTDLDETVG